jgi:Terpene synthase family 2, C-terminal metal binding
VHATDDQPTLGSAELTYGLKSIFLAALSDDQRVRIFDLAARTARALHQWVAQYPLIRRVRVWPLSLSVTAAAPFCSVESLVSMARMNLWVFTVDDLFDEEIVPFSELQRRIVRYQQILDGGASLRERERDTLTNALEDIRNDLSTYPLFSSLEQYWKHAVSQTLASMAVEHRCRNIYRTSQALPSYEDYVQHGVYSIGAPPHVWTTLIAINDASTLSHIERLQRMEYETSLCIRFANDLQSHAKELREGKINSIIIRQRELAAAGMDAETALEDARASARSRIRDSLNRLTALQNRDSTETGQPEQAIADIARFVTDFYVHHDYHTFTSGKA